MRRNKKQEVSELVHYCKFIGSFSIDNGVLKLSRYFDRHTPESYLKEATISGAILDSPVLPSSKIEYDWVHCSIKLDDPNWKYVEECVIDSKLFSPNL